MNSQPKKQFGTWTLTFLVIANMVGAGVFTTSGFGMGDLHSPAWVVAAWIVAGVIAVAGAISYGQLIRHMPESGGEYLFLSRAYHPLIGFIAGWVSMFAGFTAAIAFAALTFETYAVPQGSGLPRGSVAILVVVAAALIHGIKIKVGTNAQNFAVILKLALLLAFLIYACFKLRPGQVINDLAPLKSSEIPVLFSKQLMFIALSYMGFNAAVYIADEVKEAKSKIPTALLLGTAIVFVLYVALNFVFVYSADATVIAGSMDRVAAVSAEHLGGTWFKNLFVVIISVALFTSVTSMMMAAPRVYAKMADDRMLPSIFSFQKETPQCAIILQVILASIIICFSNLESLLGYLGTTLSICAAASVSALFLKKQRGNKSLLSPSLLIAGFYVGATVLAVVMTCLYHPKGGIASIYAALGTFLAGAVLYWIKQAFRGQESAQEK